MCEVIKAADSSEDVQVREETQRRISRQWSQAHDTRLQRLNVSESKCCFWKPAEPAGGLSGSSPRDERADMTRC